MNDFGWIDPAGTFYKCNSWEHEKYAKEVLKRDDRELEKEGWIKITIGFPTGRGIFTNSMYITQGQYNTLKKHGYSEEDLENECLFVLE